MSSSLVAHMYIHSYNIILLRNKGMVTRTLDRVSTFFSRREEREKQNRQTDALNSGAVTGMQKFTEK